MTIQKKKPESRFANAIIVSDDIYAESEEKLKGLGIEVFYSFKNKRVMTGLEKHADMQVVSIDRQRFVCAPECYEHYKDFFEQKGVSLIMGNTYLSSNYPADIAYNIIVNGKYAIHNFKHTDTLIKDCLENKIMINVSQGYSRCSVCCLNDDSFITADRGVYDSLTKAGCNVLNICSDGIMLPGFDGGFIGGSAFMISDSCLAVNGNIDYHPDSERIKAFCESLSINILSLSDNLIMDIGSCVPLYL